MNGMHMCFSFSSRASFLRTPTVLAKVILNLNHARHQQIPAVKLLPTDRRVGACDFIGIGHDYAYVLHEGSTHLCYVIFV